MRKPLWSRELLKRKKILRLELFVFVLVIVNYFHKLFVVVHCRYCQLVQKLE